MSELQKNIKTPKQTHIVDCILHKDENPPEIFNRNRKE